MLLQTWIFLLRKTKPRVLRNFRACFPYKKWQNDNVNFYVNKYNWAGLWKMYCFLLSSCIIDTIFLFNTVKLLWLNLRCIKRYRNKGYLISSAVIALKSEGWQVDVSEQGSVRLWLQTEALSSAAVLRLILNDCEISSTPVTVWSDFDMNNKAICMRIFL